MRTICPIQCGECCKDNEIGMGTPCKYLQENGCSLPPSKRPKECNDYLCTRGSARLCEPER